MEDATSYLIFVHVHPIPEDSDAHTVERAIQSATENLLPDYDVEVTAAWVSDFEVVSLGDLDALPTVTTSTSTQ
jgi:hypothetical protein